MEIKIEINKQDVLNWLNGDDPHPRVEELADLYATHIAREMGILNPKALVRVVLCDVYEHRISVDGLDQSYELEYDLLQELETDYEHICYLLADWDWLPEWV